MRSPEPGRRGRRSAAIRLRGRGLCARRSMPGCRGGVGARGSCRWPIMTPRHPAAPGDRPGRGSLLAALRRLPERQREVIVLRVLPGPRYRDHRERSWRSRRERSAPTSREPSRPCAPNCRTKPRPWKQTNVRHRRGVTAPSSRELRDAVSGVATSGPPPVESIIARGRAQRPQRRTRATRLSVGGVVLAGRALALGISLAVSPAQQLGTAPEGGIHAAAQRQRD